MIKLFKYIFFLCVCVFISCEEDSKNKHLSQKGKPLTAPEGMIFVSSGFVTSVQQRTKKKVEHFIKAFFMDENEVSVAEFREFVKATNYKTDAEKIGDSLMFKNGRWQIVPNLYWDNPLGEKKKAIDNHPVTHISYNDAIAYCTWKKRRLPTKQEWEHAARDATNNNKKYPWGDELLGKDIHKANLWQGAFPHRNTKADGFIYTAPTNKFPAFGLGFYSLAGNVWEWTSTEYIENFGQDIEKQFIIKGGSFLCHKNVCYGYKIDAIQFTAQTNSAFHLGFRTVKDIE